MLLRKAHRYRIYSDVVQEELFRRTSGCCRLVYNLCLEQKNEHLRRGRGLSKYDQMKELSDGTVFGIPRATPTERRQLENAHRTVHRSKKGSKNREKAKLRLARLQAKDAPFRSLFAEPLGAPPDPLIKDRPRNEVIVRVRHSLSTDDQPTIEQFLESRSRTTRILAHSDHYESVGLGLGQACARVLGHVLLLDVGAVRISALVRPISANARALSKKNSFSQKN